MENTSLKVLYFIVFLIPVSLFSCKGNDGVDGLNALISTQIEPGGSNCEAGGLRINHGLDVNNNNILEASEVQGYDFICNGESGALKLDNLTRLSLGSPDARSCRTNWYMTPHQSWQLLNFNKLDFANVSSILFVPSMVSFNEGNTVTVELFNVTDDVPIENSQLIHNTSDYVFKYSENLYDALPNYPITLSIRMKNSVEGTCGGLGTFSYLYVMRE